MTGPLDAVYRRFPAVLIARRNLTRTTLRSALAALGIVIGVIAIATLGMFGTTLQTAAGQSLGTIGNEVIVSPSFETGVQTLTERDVRNIERAATDAAVVPLKREQVVVAYGQQRQVTTAYGIDDPSAVFTARDGRVPSSLRGGALVGANLADRFDLRAGNSIEVQGKTYRVKAVLEAETGFTPINPNNAVVLPIDDVGDRGYDQVVVVADTGAVANRSAMAIRESLNRREKRVDVFELATITEQIGAFFDILNTFLLGIGSISLVVAGVSILNVMLMSTIERREEIGVLRAVGYQKRDVLKILLVEAALLGVLGGGVGLALSVLVGMGLNWYALQDPFVVFRLQNVLYMLLAFGFGVATSVVSGLYPAWKAANKPPVEALRG